MRDYGILRQKAVQALAGRTSRQAGRDKDLAALTWIYRWGYSAPTVADQIASPGRRGVVSRLEKKGLLTRHPTPSGGGIKGVPVNVIVLTQDGVAEVEAELPETRILPYPTHPERTIPWHQLRHDMLMQAWTAKRLMEGKISDYATPRELDCQQKTAGVKRPDATWRMKTADKTIVAMVELELTAKKDRELHQAVLALLKAVQPENGAYDMAAILSHSQAILDRYRRLLTPGANITKYERDKARHWRPAGTTKTPDWAKGRFLLERVTLW